VLTINTNVFSLQAQAGLSQWTQALGESFQRLSTGSVLRRDDPAGWAVAGRMRARARSLEVAARNTLDGISLVQTAESALGSSSELLIQMRELAIQAANGTLSGGDRQSLQEEFEQLRDEIDRVANSTDFNDIPLLNGSGGSVSLQVGSQTSSYDVFDLSLQDATVDALNLDGLDFSSSTAINDAIAAIDTAITSVNETRGRFGAYQSGLERRERAISIERENLEAAASRITDVDIAQESANLVRNQIMQQAALSLLAQANQQPQLMLRLIESAGL
jgi:flagellin